MTETLTRRTLLRGVGAIAIGGLLLAPPKPPQVTTGAATAVTGTGATLNGTVNPRGLATIARFEWGPTTAYGNTTPDISVGSGKTAVPVSRPISGLSPGTTYHFRLRASSSGGTTLGADGMFTTPGASNFYTPSGLYTPEGLY